MSLDYILLAEDLLFTDAFIDRIIIQSRANIVFLGKVNISRSDVKGKVTKCRYLIEKPQPEEDVCQPPAGTMTTQEPTLEGDLSPLSISLISVIRYLKWSSIILLYDNSTGTCNDNEWPFCKPRHIRLCKHVSINKFILNKCSKTKYCLHIYYKYQYIAYI